VDKKLLEEEQEETRTKTICLPSLKGRHNDINVLIVNDLELGTSFLDDALRYMFDMLRKNQGLFI